MKKLNVLLILSVLLGLISQVKSDKFFNHFSEDVVSDSEILKDGQNKILKLHEDNFVTLRGRIDEESASRFISDVMKLKGDKIYVYLVTPGGSIISGNSIIQLIDTLSSIGKEIICIADHAYSMGFVIFQSCPKRYIMPHSIIMQHQASLSISGPLENVKNNLKLVEKIDKKANPRQSQRLNLTMKEFHEMTQHDLWLYGEEILEYKAADEIINVVCNFDTEKTVIHTYHTLFGDVSLEFSMCPLVHAPLKISFNVNEAKIIEKVTEEYEKFNLI